MATVFDEGASFGILSHACVGHADLRPEECQQNNMYEKDYTRKLLQDLIDYMEANLTFLLNESICLTPPILHP